MNQAYFYAFLVSLFSLAAELLSSDRKWWKVFLYSSAWIYCSYPFYSGLKEFFTSDRSKIKRMRYQITKYLKGDLLDEHLQVRYFRREEIYCNPFTFNSTNCGHSIVLVCCPDSDFESIEMEDVDDDLRHMFITKDTTTDCLHRFISEGFVVAPSQSRKGVKWSRVHYRRLNEYINEIHKVCFRGYIGKMCINLHYFPESQTLRYSFKSNLCSESEKGSIPCTWEKYNYCCKLIKYIPFWSRQCCFVSNPVMTFSGVKADIYHCYRVDELLREICSGSKLKYVKAERQLKYFENTDYSHKSFFKGISIAKNGLEFHETLLKYLNSRYDENLADSILSAFAIYSTSKGVVSKLKSAGLGNWQRKRLIVDVSYLREKWGGTYISGSDLSIMPTKLVRDFYKSNICKKQMSPQALQLYHENFFSFNEPKDFDKSIWVEELKKTKKTKCFHKLELLKNDIKEYGVLCSPASTFDSRRSEIVFKTSAFQDGKPLKRVKESFYSKVISKRDHVLGETKTLDNLKDKIDNATKIRGGVISSCKSFYENLDIQISEVDKVFPNQMLKVFLMYLDFFKLEVSDYPNLFKHKVKLESLNDIKKVAKPLSSKKMHSYEKNQKARLRRKLRSKGNLDPINSVDSGLKMAKGILKDIKSLYSYFMSGVKVIDKVLLKREKLRNYNLRVLDKKGKSEKGADQKDTDSLEVEVNKQSSVKEVVQLDTLSSPKVSDDVPTPHEEKNESNTNVETSPSQQDLDEDIKCWVVNRKTNDYPGKPTINMKVREYNALRARLDVLHKEFDEAKSLPKSEIGKKMRELNIKFKELGYRECNTITRIPEEIDEEKDYESMYCYDSD